MAAFFVLVEVLVVVLSRVVPWFAVGVVGFDVGGDVDARGGLRSRATLPVCALCLYDHPHHPSLSCLELLLLLLLHIFRHRPRS